MQAVNSLQNISVMSTHTMATLSSPQNVNSLGTEGMRAGMYKALKQKVL